MCSTANLQKNVSEYKHTANAELQKCLKFVNILSTMNKKVSGNKRKTNSKLHYKLKILQMYSTANLQKSSRYDQIKRLAETNIKQPQNYKSAEKFVNIPSTIHKKVSGNTENGRKVTFFTC